jgi:hypothetical protein
MVVSKAADDLGNDLADGDAGYQLIGRRIAALVSDGRLVAQGDVKNWRFSEVRRPDECVRQTCALVFFIQYVLN